MGGVPVDPGILAGRTKITNPARPEAYLSTFRYVFSTRVRVSVAMLTVALPVTGMTFGEGFAKEAKVPVLACVRLR